MSGSSLSTLAQCPLRWFLDHEARASSARGTAVGFGSVVHALADEVGRGELAPETDALMARLDTVWDALAFEAPWRATQERDAARAALGRFVKWHLNVRGRTQVATEQQFETQLEIGGAVVTLRGRVDRLEVDEGGRLHVVDFKTGKYKAKNAELEHHPQLGVYQAVANAGAFDGLVGPGVPCGGAELVQLRHDAKAGSDLPAVQAQTAFADSADDGAWFTDLLATAVAYVLGERFPATPGEWCNTCPFKSCCPAWPEGRQVVA